ncbi:MAG: cyclic nucleotide-binding domain-containing protein, partial [Myxococcota bacterium]
HVALVAHVGDSRMYVHRGEKVHQLTQDHTFVAEAIRSGLVKAGDPALAEHSNLVTRAVGPLPQVLVDAFTVDLLPGDTLLLCSDGLYEYFEDSGELAEHLAADGLAADALVEKANERGGHDNITALLLRVPGATTKAAERVTATFSALSHIDLFGELSLPEISRVTRQLDHVEKTAGEPVFRQGDVCDGLYILLSGEVAVHRDDSEIAVLGAGCHFGEMALLNQRPRSATVIGNADLELLHLSRSAFFELVQLDHVIGVKVLWKLAQTLSLRLEDTFESPEEITERRNTLTFGLFPSPIPRG